MRILIFSWRDIKHPEAGGAEAYLNEQARYWIESGNSVEWISARFPGALAKETVDGVVVRRSGGKYSVYLRAIFQYFKVDRPDIVVDVENGIPFFTPLYSKAPVVLIIHHIHTRVWNREYRWPLANIGRFLEQKAMPAVYKKTRIATVSQTSEAMVRGLFPKGDIQIIPNAVSSNLHPGTKSKEPEIVFVGRLKRYKSVHFLIRAMAKLSSPNVTLNIIGRGDDEPRLKKIARELNLHNVNFLGYLDEERKMEMLQRAWIMVNPSIIEGWGVVNIEANACGTPVVGSNVPGIRDSVLDNRSGLLFEYGNVDELAAKIEYLLENAGERERMGREALMWAGEYSWQTSAEKMYGIFEDVVQ